MLERLATLFGGGGFLGRYIAQNLLKAGARVRIAERNPRDAFFLRPLGGLGQVQFIGADIRKPETLDRAVYGADLVINLVGILDGDFESVHIGGAANAARAAGDAGVADFIQISAIGADADGLSSYSQTKGRGEAAVRETFPDAIVIRPSIVFGPEDRFINRFASMARMIPMAVPVIRPWAQFQPVYVADVAEAVARAAMNPRDYRGGTFELGGPEILSMEEINRFILDAIGKPGKDTIAVPDAIGRTMAKFGWLPGAPITWDQWQSLQSDNVVSDGAKGFESFGITPRPLSAVSEQMLVQYSNQGRFAGKTAA